MIVRDGVVVIVTSSSLLPTTIHRDSESPFPVSSYSWTKFIKQCAVVFVHATHAIGPLCRGKG